MKVTIPAGTEVMALDTRDCVMREPTTTTRDHTFFTEDAVSIPTSRELTYGFT